MTTPFSLDGLNQKPFYLHPEFYDLMIYPCEWQGEIGIATNLVEELDDAFYRRSYGRYSVYNLWTMFVRQQFAYWFEDDIPLGYRNMLTNAVPDEMPTIFFTDAFSQLQAAKLKELRLEEGTFRQHVDDYVAIPLVPAALAVTSVEDLSLQEGRDPALTLSLLNEFKNFVA